MTSRLRSQINFLNEIEKLKLVSRRNKTIDRSRAENSAEHSWHVAIMAMILVEHTDSHGLNLLRVLKMLLIHDLVEIHAGDTWAYDVGSNNNQAQREHESAHKLFSLLPADQGDELNALWREFEDRKTSEARFAASVDALQPLTNHLLSGSPEDDHPLPACTDVVSRKSHIASSSEALWGYAQEIIEESARRGLYK